MKGLRLQLAQQACFQLALGVLMPLRPGGFNLLNMIFVCHFLFNETQELILY